VSESFVGRERLGLSCRTILPSRCELLRAQHLPTGVGAGPGGLVDEQATVVQGDDQTSRVEGNGEGDDGPGLGLGDVTSGPNELAAVLARVFCARTPEASVWARGSMRAPGCQRTIRAGPSGALRKTLPLVEPRAGHAVCGTGVGTRVDERAKVGAARASDDVCKGKHQAQVCSRRQGEPGADPSCRSRSGSSTPQRTDCTARVHCCARTETD